MKVFPVLLVVAVAICASSARRFGGEFLHRDPFPIGNSSAVNGRILLSKTITQKVDHFDETNTDTWEMRYFSNSEHYVHGGPLFIYLGGEWEISFNRLAGGHMFDMAKEMNGYMFYTEHRYYGKSHPTPDSSAENLKYLTVDQALADVIHFVDYQKANIKGAANSGVIVVGGSYSATMAAWLRQKYPEKINGAWASSAPLNAQMDFPEYKEVVSEAIRKYGPSNCADDISAAFRTLERLIEQNQVDRIKEEFNLCKEIDPNDSLDVWNFFSTITDEFAGLIQYHRAGDLDKACEVIMDPEFILNPIGGVAKWVTSNFDPNSCIDTSYEGFIEKYKNPAFGNDIMRQWIYQTCNEFGWYQSSTSSNQIFGTMFPVNLNIKMCADLYDNQFTQEIIEQKIAQTNVNHLGFETQVTNVFFTHGEIDPWRPMGVQTDVNADSPVVILEGHAHCQDLASIQLGDSQQMRATKEAVTARVREWLGMKK